MFPLFAIRRCSPIFSLMVICCLALCSIGCAGPPGTINAAALDNNLSGVLSRHDAYVAADMQLDATQRTIYLRSSELLRVLQDTAMGRSAPPTVPPAVTTTGPPQ